MVPTPCWSLLALSCPARVTGLELLSWMSSCGLWTQHIPPSRLQGALALWFSGCPFFTFLHHGSTLHPRPISCLSWVINSRLKKSGASGRCSVCVFGGLGDTAPIVLQRFSSSSLLTPRVGVTSAVSQCTSLLTAVSYSISRRQESEPAGSRG